MTQLQRLKAIRDLCGLNDIQAKNTVEKLIIEAIKEEQKRQSKDGKKQP